MSDIIRDLAQLEPEQIIELHNTLGRDSEQFARVVMGHIVKEVPSYQSTMYKYFDRSSGLNFTLKYLGILVFRGGAKAQSLNANILTPKGWRKLKDLKLGDYVIGSNGKPTKIICLHPVMEMDLYKLTTRDNRSTFCNAEHLWKVDRISGGAGFYKDKNIVKSIDELRKFPYKKSRYDKRYGKNYDECYFAIAPSAPIFFNERNLPIDPYTLGAWLGDGHSASARFTTVDTEILTYFPYETKKKKGRYLYQIYGGLHKALRINGLLNNKHIPQEYLFSSIKQREALLQGLLDTDGTIKKTGHVAVFCNKNEKLIDGVVELVRGLGGSACKSVQKTRFNSKSDYKKSFRVFIKVPENILPVRLSRKKNLWKGSIKLRSAIVSIEYSHKGFGRCISVENEDGLYVTDDYLLTHNSTIKSIKTIQDVCHQLEPMTLFLSEVSDQAERDLVQVQEEIEGNDIIKLLYGDLVGSKIWSTKQLEFANGCYLAAKGSTSKVRGIKHKAQRPTKFWLDDIEGEDNTKTKTQRDEVARWVEAQVMFAEDPFSKFIFLGTKVHDLAFLANLKHLDIFKPPRGAYLEIPIAEDFDGNNPAWPQRYPKKFIIERKNYLKQQGRLKYYYQEWYHIAAKEGEAKFHVERIVYLEDAAFHKYYSVTWLEAKSIKEKIPMYVFQGVDPNAKLTDGSDCFVIFTIGIIPDGNPIILNIFADKVSPEEHAEKVMEYADLYAPKQVVIETYAYQNSLAGWVRKYQRERKRFFPVIEFDEPKSKKDKYLTGLIPYINGGMVFRIPGIDNYSMFEQQAENFSGGKDHDDTLDGFFLALHEHFVPPKINVDKKILQIKNTLKKRESEKRISKWKNK